MKNEIFHNDQEFDDFLNENFKNHTTIPNDDLWEGIDAQLAQNKLIRSTKQIHRLKIISFTLAISFVVSFLYFQFRIFNIKNSTSELVTKEPSYEVIGNPDIISKSKDSELTTKTRASAKINLSGAQKNELKKNTNILAPLGRQPEKSIEKILDSNAIGQSVSIITEENRSRNNTESYEANADKPKHSKSESLAAVNTKNVSNTIQIIEHLALSEEKLEPNTDIEKTRKTDHSLNSTNESKLASENVMASNEFMANSEKDFLNIKPVSVTVYNTDTLKNATKNIITPSLDINSKVKKSTPDSKPKQFFIEGFFSPEISFRMLSTNSDYYNTTYNKTYFNARDKAKFTYSTGLYAGYKLNSKINLVSGFYFSQYAQKFKTESIHVLHNAEQGYFMYTSSGIASLTFTSVDSIAAETFVNSSLRYNYLNLPFIVEYRISPYQTLNWGLNLNYLMSQELNWQAENATGNSEPFYDELSGVKLATLSLIFGTSFEKSLTKKIKLIISPTLKIHVMSLSNNAPVKAFPYSWGLHTGLRYYF